MVLKDKEIFMLVSNGSAPMLHAFLYEVEIGLFCVGYRTLAVGSVPAGLPIYQLGEGEFDAQQRLEKTIEALGYRLMIWADPHVAPPGCSESYLTIKTAGPDWGDNEAPAREPRLSLSIH
jgi:hypothetical protein